MNANLITSPTLSRDRTALIEPMLDAISVVVGTYGDAWSREGITLHIDQDTTLQGTLFLRVLQDNVPSDASAEVYQPLYTTTTTPSSSTVVLALRWTTTTYSLFVDGVLQHTEGYTGFFEPSLSVEGSSTIEQALLFYSPLTTASILALSEEQRLWEWTYAVAIIGGLRRETPTINMLLSSTTPLRDIGVTQETATVIDLAMSREGVVGMPISVEQLSTDLGITIETDVPSNDVVITQTFSLPTGVALNRTFEAL